jgi:hypothetical protein
METLLTSPAPTNGASAELVTAEAVYTVHVLNRAGEFRARRERFSGYCDAAEIARELVEAGVPEAKVMHGDYLAVHYVWLASHAAVATLCSSFRR